MSSLRVLHAVFSSRIAGSERYCVDLANRQVAAGHEVHVAGADSSPLRRALSPDVTFHGFSWFLRGFRLRHLLDELAPDICHGHLSAACKALGRAAGRHASVATLHVGFKAHQHARLDGLICVNRAQSTRLDGYTGLARVIPNWLPQAPAGDSTAGLRQELGIDEEVFLVGAVGRLHPSKGMDVLIAAFQAGAPAKAALVIIGEGPQRPELERLRNGDPRIHFLGYRPDVHQCLRDLDLFVSPSREESFGLAILEAMSAGLPIVSTAAEGPAEFLRDQPVILVPPGSADGIAEAIAARYRQFSTESRSKIGYDLSLFDPAARLANITDFYGHIINVRQTDRAKAVRPAVAAT